MEIITRCDILHFGCTRGICVNFKQWVEKNYIDAGRTQIDAAKDLGLLTSTVNQYMNLKRFPLIEGQSKLEAHCEGLDLSQWRNEYLAEKKRKSAA